MAGNPLLLGKGAASLHEWCPTFQKTLAPSSLVRGSPRILQSVRKCSPNGTASSQKKLAHCHSFMSRNCSFKYADSLQKLFAQWHSFMSRNCSLKYADSLRKSFAQRHSFMSRNCSLKYAESLQKIFAQRHSFMSRNCSLKYAALTPKALRPTAQPHISAEVNVQQHTHTCMYVCMRS